MAIRKQRRKKRGSLVIDSSLSLAAIGRSTPPQNDVFLQAAGNRDLSFTTFLRKEFIWRLVDYSFELADAILVAEDVSHAFMLASQTFGARSGKNFQQIFSILVSEFSSINTASEELATMLYRVGDLLVEEYDSKLTGPIHNRSECQIGDIEVVVDYRRPQLVRQQLSEKKRAVQSCNAFSIVQKLLEGKSDPSKVVPSAISKPIEKAKEITGREEPFNCSKCEKIGDFVIVAEMNEKEEGLACDRSLVAIAEFYEKKISYVDSVLASEVRYEGYAGDSGTDSEK